jgi:hypothetical protein
VHRNLSKLLFILCAAAPLGSRADVPPLLSGALERWAAGQGDVAFTQETRVFESDGAVKEERIERYDPSLPDSRRWRLIEVNGAPATDAQRLKWESHKNGKPKRNVDKSPSEYLDLDHARLVGDTPKVVRYQIPLRSDVERLIDAQELDIVLTIDKQTGNISQIGATLREPMRLLFGLARITELEVDLRINPVEDGSSVNSDEVEPGSTARVTISRLGRPVEYNWSDFKRVASYGAPQVSR